MCRLAREPRLVKWDATKPLIKYETMSYFRKCWMHPMCNQIISSLIFPAKKRILNSHNFVLCLQCGRKANQKVTGGTANVQLPWPYLSRASKSICVLFSLSCNLFMIATFVCDREGSSQSSWTCTILSSLPLFSNHSLLFPLLYFFPSPFFPPPWALYRMTKGTFIFNTSKIHIMVSHVI